MCAVSAESNRSSLPPDLLLDRMERWTYLLDDFVRLPFTRFSFGLDVILGLLPVIGDFAGLLCGLPLLGAAIYRRRPIAVVLFMLLNVLIDAVMGSIPVAGDVFDIAWKSHRKNLRLLKNPERLPEVLREAWWKLAGLAGIVILLIVFLISLLVMVLDAYVGLLGWV
jgi:hypothetical protein